MKPSSDPRKKAVSGLDRVFSKMIRERDADLPCIVCGRIKPLEAGHFRGRGMMSTRWDPINVNGECSGCNNQDYSGYGEGKSYEYSVGLDKRWGKGTAKMLYKVSQTMKQWSIEDMNLLKDAARHGYPVYAQVYRDLKLK